MAILIPFIIIFLCSAYLYLNEVSTIGKIIVYSFEILFLFGSFLLYKKIKKDIKQQQINQTQLQINDILKKLGNTTDIKEQKALKHKLKLLESELIQ